MESRRGMKNEPSLGRFSGLSSSRLSQRAASSSDLFTSIVERFGLGVEADHHRGGERPGLRGAVGDVLHAHPHLLVDLARDGVLEALARLDEARQGRMHAAREMRAAAEQALVAAMDQHDHGGIGAREMLGLAALVGAPADMAAARHLGGGAAHAAIAMAAVPVGHAAGIGQDRTLAREQERADLAQVDELAELLQRHILAGDVDGEIGRALDIAQEDGMVGLVDDGARHHALQEHRLGIAAALHQVLLGVDRNEASRTRRGELDHALVVLALMAGAVDFSAGIGISGSLLHRPRTVPQRRRGCNLAVSSSMICISQRSLMFLSPARGRGA